MNYNVQLGSYWVQYINNNARIIHIDIILLFVIDRAKEMHV